MTKEHAVRLLYVKEQIRIETKISLFLYQKYTTANNIPQNRDETKIFLLKTPLFPPLPTNAYIRSHSKGSLQSEAYFLCKSR